MSGHKILPCPPLRAGRIAEMKRSILEWLQTPALSSAAEAFGKQAPQNADVHTLAKWYLDFSECWDFRARQKKAQDGKLGEGVRWQVANDGLNEKQRSSALEAALKLGLMDNTPTTRREFDCVWVLGGAKLSCLLRSRLAAQTIQTLQNKPKAVVLLGSARPVGDAERDAVNTYAPNAATEFDLFVAAARKEFGVDEIFGEERRDDDKNPNNSRIVRKYTANGLDVFVVAAPSSDPQRRRANSADTYEFSFEYFNVAAGASILLVTSRIYVPYQHLEAVRTVALPHDVFLETVGFPAEWGGPLQGMNEPSNYLQEIRSTIQSVDRFLTRYG